MALVEARPVIRLANILFPTDFSERSAVALPYAAAIARRYASKVYLAHVLSPDGPVLAPQNESPVPNRQISPQELAVLDRCDLLRDVRYEALLEQGEIWDVLSQVIQEHEVDLIVLATHGRGGLKRLVLGSVAEEIIREAPCPVLTIGPEVPSQVEVKSSLQQVVFATDFRPGSLAALMYAVFFAEQNRARLTLLHVLDSEHAAERDKAEHRLREMLPADNYLLWEPKFLVETGAPAETVLKVAAAENADFIVLCAREVESHWVPRRFTWTTLHQILCGAHCPVLTARNIATQ